MLISCPKCVAVYDIEADKIPEQGRRFKCIECGHIWNVLPQEVSQIEPENKPKAQIILPSEDEHHNDDVHEMFNRLSQNTNDLFTDSEKYTVKITENDNYTKQPQRAIDRETDGIGIFKRKMQVFFSPLFLNSLLILIIAALTTYIGYYNRYDVVRFIPSMENVYDNFNIASVRYGQDIAFEQVTTKQIQRGRKYFIEVSGRLFNKGKYKAKLFPVKATMLNLSDEIVAEDVKFIMPDSLAPQMSSLFFFVLENKTMKPKKINLSFVTDNHQNQIRKD